MSTAPLAPRRPTTITQHQQTRVDDYFWMRYRDDPAVLEYLQAENDYAGAMLAHTRPLQEQLYQEMKARLKEDDATVPERRGRYYYYTRLEAGRQYPFYCRKLESLDAPEEIVLDQNALAEGQAFCRIGAYAPSPDGQKLAYSVDADGTENCTLYVKNLADGTLYPEVIPGTYGDVYGHHGVEWAADSLTFFYVKRDAALRPYQVYRHVLGAGPAGDPLLYHEADEAYFLYLSKTRSGAFVTAQSQSTLTSEWRLLPADQPQAAFEVFAPRRPGVEYEVEHQGGRFFVVTNDGALNFKLVETPVGATTPEHWRDVLPHRADVLVQTALAFDQYLAVFERRLGLKQVRIVPADDLSQARYVPFPEPVYDVLPAANPEYHTHLVRFTYSSLVTPRSVVDFHMDTGEWELKKQDEIPSGHDPSAYVTERLLAPAPDGLLVPLSLVYRRGLEKDGRNPALLYGYGSYGHSMEPGFDSNRFSLIDRGFVYAIAHVRGGSELGRAWYESGKMLSKRNTFTDFIAAAEHLIALGYTARDKLAISGRSAGGLLVGACLTMRPDLFKAVVAGVPFVDVVNTMSDPSIPLTTLEYDQWGNPADEDAFHYLMTYSPYDNVRATDYPHLLITTGLNDPRVAYWEPAKFAARLRALKTDQNLLLLVTNLGAGHAGASGRYDYLKEIARDYAFLIDQLIGST